MAHTHEGDRNYYIDQLCTVGVSAALGGVCMALYFRGALGLLADPFRPAVLVGGAALILVALVRGVALFLSVGKTAANHAHDHHHHDHDHHGHDHPHDHPHDHEHGHHHHDHDHHHHHDHEHAHDHGHDHGHSHGWNPIRYVFLLVPIVLFLVRMPSAAFNERFSDFVARFEAGKIGKVDLNLQMVGKSISNLGLQIDKSSLEDPLKVVRVVPGGAAEKAGVKPDDVLTGITLYTDEDGTPLKEPEEVQAGQLSLDAAARKLRGKPKTTVKLTLEREGEPKPIQAELTREVVIQNLGFKELERAALNAFTRKAYEGMTVRLKGQIVAKGEIKAFSMVRVKITCCGADATTLKVVITLDPQSPEMIRVEDSGDYKYMQWVEVTGEVSFHKTQDRNEYVPVVQIASKAEGIRPCDPEAFLQ